MQDTYSRFSVRLFPSPVFSDLQGPMQDGYGIHQGWMQHPQCLYPANSRSAYVAKKGFKCRNAETTRVNTSTPPRARAPQQGQKRAFWEPRQKPACIGEPRLVISQETPEPNTETTPKHGGSSRTPLIRFARVCLKARNSPSELLDADASQLRLAGAIAPSALAMPLASAKHTAPAGSAQFSAQPDRAIQLSKNELQAVGPWGRSWNLTS